MAIAVLLYQLIGAEFGSWADSVQTDKRPLATKVIAVCLAVALLLSGTVAIGWLGFRSAASLALVVVVTVICDTAAMFFGRKFGKKFGRRNGKPLLAFAPTKTAAGFVGSLFFGVLLLYVLRLIGVFIELLLGAPAVVFLIFDLVSPRIVFALSIAASVGDVLCSFIKRAFGVKDSGELLAKSPGWTGCLWSAMSPHGGFLDRFCGILAAALVMATLSF